jgi:hypothetical protein
LSQNKKKLKKKNSLLGMAICDLWLSFILFTYLEVYNIFKESAQ